MPLQRLPEPMPMGIEGYRLDFDLESDEALHLDVLSPAERARAGRFLRAADRLRFAETRAATRRLLAGRLGCGPAEVPLAQDAHGKPFIEKGGEVPLFNVSHSGGHALIAVADPGAVSAVGIDIEQCREGLDIDSLAQTVLTDRERVAVTWATDPQHALYQCWVGKEAVLKAIGVGIAEHLRCVGIHPDREGRWSVESTVPQWSGLEAMALSAPPGYMAALAWRSKVPAPG
ncbi:4'-phosphopantetheinyl transferase superfamily protein [Acidovorax sp. SUPP950]|uniref:4'-phosphopantetheinyl transferase family protein n=1 Tax=unclassified Acidovorax TaxID=2684926 RepID=UPI0023C4DC0E|nr:MULTISPECIES: 4'-phosphopantetheinyl transferase superfamily protein [Comamonadaceae]WOI46183.1 4'-phosphopantetheinyl transferase superfamily protein [Paracidovorax avenae]GKS74499.1 4'-phosphopantetheinyl transferase superfamily protein [Acidovorax sp. SUPP950]